MSVVLVAHPSPDLYGSDRQLLEAVRAFGAHGHRVIVYLPSDGPLRERLEQVSEVRIAPFAVLRRALLKPGGMLALLLRLPLTVRRLVTVIRSVRPDVVYVNTVTIPWWIFAARLAGVPVVVHVHEAEGRWPRVVRWLLAAPLLFATSVVVNSEASGRALASSVKALAGRTTLVYNGLTGPEYVPPLPALAPGEPARLTLVARLSPRKGVDIALEAVALLLARGYDVTLDICGSAFAGYEWFEDELRRRADAPDLAGRVRFHGYVDPTWPVLAASSCVLVPSRVEPFGNTAVEGMLAGRPVVASDVQGLAEIVHDGRTGLLVPPADPWALAGAIARILDDAQWAASLANRGRADALRRFAADRYSDDIVREVELPTHGGVAAVLEPAAVEAPTGA